MKKNDKITVITCAAAFALNVALFSVKLYVGLCANSISIYSDAVNNMFDSLSGLAAFICFAALLSSSSEGTRAIIKKAEQFFSFVMSVIILLTGLYFAYNSLERLFYPTPISYLTRYLVMLIVTVAVKFVMFFAYRGVYRITGSPIIKVMAADSILDCFITLATVMSLTVSQYVEFAVDAVFGLVISAVLITSAVKLAKKSGAVMLDFVGSGKREEISEIFDSLGVAVDYITYRRTGTDIEAFAKPKFPKNTDENERSCQKQQAVQCDRNKDSGIKHRREIHIISILLLNQGCSQTTHGKNIGNVDKYHRQSNDTIFLGKQEPCQNDRYDKTDGLGSNPLSKTPKETAYRLLLQIIFHHAILLKTRSRSICFRTPKDTAKTIKKTTTDDALPKCQPDRQTRK